MRINIDYAQSLLPSLFRTSFTNAQVQLALNIPLSLITSSQEVEDREPVGQR